jgi:hypothetical protein
LKTAGSLPFFVPEEAALPDSGLLDSELVLVSVDIGDHPSIAELHGKLSGLRPGELERCIVLPITAALPASP